MARIPDLHEKNAVRYGLWKIQAIFNSTSGCAKMDLL
jgi:hypothetical protein